MEARFRTSTCSDTIYVTISSKSIDETNVGLIFSGLVLNLLTTLTCEFRFFVRLVKRKVLKAKVKPYIPDFKLAFEHFCIHAGGRAVLDEIQNNLNLSDWHMEPSRMTLHRFGNTSSSSLWYELSYTESKGRVNKGDRVWQIAFGSGFKCNSAVWKSLRVIHSHEVNANGNPWADCIQTYPVKLPHIAKT